MLRIDNQLIETVIDKASKSERKRSNLNFHKHSGDTLQRMLNVLNPDSYVCPHKHENPDKREAFLILKGELLVIEFDDQGNISNHCILSASEGNYGVEMSPRIYHTIIALQPSTVVYELKDGPYNPDTDKNFAPWAPAEGDSKALKYLKDITTAIIK
jgi:cupin fold WbuC family metalloprotein